MLGQHFILVFTARAMLALQALYLLQQFRLSACLSVTCRYCVKTTARSTVQFAGTTPYPSNVRDRKRSSITLNKNSARAFQRAIHQVSTPPLTSSRSKCLELSYFGRLRQ